jgi:hypothetical protein
MLRTALLAATAAIAITSGAQARMVGLASYGTWTLAVHFDDASGAFQACTIQNIYTTGHTLIMAGSLNALTLTIGHPSWRLNQGWNYPIDVQIDSLRFQPTRTLALSHNLIQAEIGPYAIRPLAAGNWMRVQPLNVSLSLAGSRAAMLALADCITTHGRAKPNDPTNPWANI